MSKRKPSTMTAAAYRLSISEAELQAAIVDLALTLGYACYHTHDSRKSREGFPDLVLVRVRGDLGRLLVWELKREGEYPAPEQQMWLALFRAVPGVDSRVVRPSDWQSGLVERLLQ